MCKFSDNRSWNYLLRRIRNFQTISRTRRSIKISRFADLHLEPLAFQEISLVSCGTSFLTDQGDVAKDLAKKVRLLCFVLTSPQTHWTKAAHVKATWGKRCDHLLFMSSVKDDKLPSIAIPIGHEDREHLWEKTKLSLSEVSEIVLC